LIISLVQIEFAARSKSGVDITSPPETNLFQTMTEG